MAAAGDADGGAAFVYLLRCADGSYYTGWTSDLQRRLAAHQAGRGARYTRSRLPVMLAYCEQHPSRTDARKREAALRRQSHAKKDALAAEQNGHQVGS